MAEEVEYSSRPDHKLKYYKDQTTAPPSSSVSTASPIVSQSSSSDLTQPPSSPPVDEIHLVKQKVAREIENGGGGGTDDSNDFTQKPPLALGGQQQIPSCSTTTQVAGGSSKKIINVPNGMLCVIMGRTGETIESLRVKSGAKIQVTKDIDADPNSASRAIELVGTPEQISKAEKLIMDDLVAVNQTMSNYYSLDELMVVSK